MAEILLCNQPFNVTSLTRQCGIRSSHVLDVGCVSPGMLVPYRPYLHSEQPSSIEQSILTTLGHTSSSRDLTDMALLYGADNTVAIAQMMAKLQEYGIGVMGASTSVYAGRVDGFAGAVRRYQATLMELRDVAKSNPAARSAAGQKVQAAFQAMQKEFRNELSVINSHSRAHRGTPLSSSKRATNIALNSRTIAKLNVVDQIQANNLVKFAKHGRFLGNGLAVIDFGSRVGNVHNSYKAGGNWERDLFVESSSFAISTYAGSLVVSAGLSFLVVATPVGWVGLIVGGLIIAGTAAGASMGLNKLVKDNSGAWYDSIMKSLNSP